MLAVVALVIALPEARLSMFSLKLTSFWYFPSLNTNGTNDTSSSPCFLATATVFEMTGNSGNGLPLIF